VVRSSGEALLHIVNDILDFSKIEAQHVRLELIEFNPTETVEDVVELLGKAADSKGVELTCLVQKDVPRLLQGDPSRLRQILTNLVSNAVKFTNEGEIAVTVSLEECGAGQARLRFEVRDTGIGVSSLAQEYLFQPFRQADGSTTRKYGGTGLGLAISKRLAEMMGGEIGVRSAPGDGSTFWFTARFDEAPMPSIVNAGAGRLRAKRVLIVDDNTHSRSVLAYMLDAWGMKPVEAGSGREALELLLERQQAGEQVVVPGHRVEDEALRGTRRSIRRIIHRCADVM